MFNEQVYSIPGLFLYDYMHKEHTLETLAERPNALPPARMVFEAPQLKKMDDEKWMLKDFNG